MNARLVDRSGIRSCQAVLILLAVGFHLLAGCAGPEGAVELELRAVSPVTEVAVSKPGRLKVAVVPLADRRPDPHRLGARISPWGSKTTLTVVGGDLGEMLAMVIIEHLKRRTGVQSWIDKPGVRAPDGGPDITLSGEVLECVVDADSWAWGTALMVETKISTHALNHRTGSAFHATLKDKRSQWVFLFEPESVATLLQTSLHDSLDKLVAQWEVEDHDRHLK